MSYPKITETLFQILTVLAIVLTKRSMAKDFCDSNFFGAFDIGFTIDSDHYLLNNEKLYKLDVDSKIKMTDRKSSDDNKEPPNSFPLNVTAKIWTCLYQTKNVVCSSGNESGQPKPNWTILGFLNSSTKFYLFGAKKKLKFTEYQYCTSSSFDNCYELNLCESVDNPLAIAYLILIGVYFVVLVILPFMFLTQAYSESKQMTSLATDESSDDMKTKSSTDKNKNGEVKTDPTIAIQKQSASTTDR